jgi:hypothetical protein
MKKVFFNITIFILLTSCSQKQTQTDNKDSIIKVVASPDSTNNDMNNEEILYLEDVLQCVDLQGLEKKFGKENVKKDAVVQTGDGQFKATKIFPDTDQEVEIYWKDGQEFKVIQDVMVRPRMGRDESLIIKSPWSSREGLKMGMKMSEVVALNGKTFTITGIGWDLGGNVVSWEGGKLDKKNVSVRFNDFSEDRGGLTEQEYSSITGEREFDTAHPAIKKLNPTVDQLSVYKKPAIDAALGQKMTKEVEKKQVKH